MAFGDFIQAATSVNSTGPVATIGGAGWTSNITAGNIISLAVRIGNSAPSITVTSDSTPATFTEAISQVQTADGHKLYGFHGINQAGGVKPTITITTGVYSLRACACEFTGSSNTALDKTASAEGTSTAPASGATATRTVAAELQIGFGSSGSTLTYTAGTGFTLRGTQPAGRVALESIVRSSTGTEQADFALSASDTWACLTATYSDSAGGGISVPVAYRNLQHHGIA